MKTIKITFAFILHFTFFILHSGHSQDSLQYSQESGTLQKQRFIDQYDYVFMTKEPTRWMLKAGLEQTLNYSNIKNSTGIGVEYKLSPSFSLGVNYTIVNNGNRPEFNNIKREIMGRWYYDMKRRIDKGKSANNFSGNYFELNYGRIVPRYKDSFYGGFEPLKYELVNLSYGIQRRFFNYGWSDFSLSIQHFRILSNTVIYSNSPFSYGGINDWSIQSNYKIGFALGDLKKSNKAATCDVFKCFEEQKSWVKVEVPSVRIGNLSQAIIFGIEFERKIGVSPFSVNLGYQTQFQGFSFDVKQNADSTFTPFRRFSYTWTHNLNAELRYYALQKLQAAKGHTANNLSGLYVGVNAGTIFETNAAFRPQAATIRFIGPVIGFQKKLFKNGFIDLKIGAALSTKSVTYNTPLLRNTSSLKLGFAF